MKINRHKMKHMSSVAGYMYYRAKDYGVEPEMAYMLGLMHDIGYLCGRRGHEQKGAELLDMFGSDRTYIACVNFHGVNPYKLTDDNLSSAGYKDNPAADVESLRHCGQRPYEELAEDIKSNRYLTLLYEADMRVDADGKIVGFKARYNDINRRYDDEDIAETCRDTIAYVFEWCERNGIPAPPRMDKVRKDMEL